MTTFWKRYDIRLTAIFLASLLIYLLIAAYYHAPRGYYGTIDAPRFADPWMARSETILNGGLLYRDVFTTTPPLTNLLLIPPSLVPIYFGNINPWATLSYMLWFSLFNLFTALVLLKMGTTEKEGFQAAVFFLLNPLTFGNTVLRRQDESVVVFFIALALMLVLQRRHVKAAVAIGLGLLVKLSAAVVLPVAFLHHRKWHYAILPGIVFAAGMAPFLLLAGRDAIFWDFGTGGAQHPFQYRGVSLVGLWNQFHTEQIPLLPMSILLVAATAVATLFIAWKQPGILQGVIILVAAVFLFSPKLHTGYFSVLVLAMAPLLKKWATVGLYWLLGLVAIVADFYKWPIVNIEAAFGWMVVTLALMCVLAYQLCRPVPINQS
ncbi:MAG: DUF2029 domain-containing protein [Ardenticatenaceae bacterium]|nr:DUF2029 domain-containing protein [Ardenticatenaceae bacterium]